jgi:ferrous iron transport protein B
MKKIIIALVGNPNCGKSTIFNNLTGAAQVVGNYPGVTVEKKEGICKYKDFEIKVVDLPGMYSLNGNSEDEKVSADFLLNNKPNLIHLI